MMLALLMAISLPSFALTFTVDGIKYETLKSEGEVGVSRQMAALYGDIVIPETVQYSGKTYKVTSICDYAFYGCSKHDFCLNS